jgi:hypothetical protein
MNPDSQIPLLTQNDVIWKQELYFLMFSGTYFDLVFVPDISDYNGCGGGASADSCTWPLEQHIPDASPDHLKALQYE